MTGSDGKCEGIANAQECSAIPCSSNTTATTDEVCKTVNTGCITTGLGCVSVLPICSSYKVSDLACT